MKSGRFWEVDAARGIAILMMVVYHLAYDLDTFGGYPIESTSGLWAWFADATASAFLFLVGVSLAISYGRATSSGERRNLFGKYLLRGLRILGYALVLTGVSLILGMGVIAFGILHVIAISIILAYPLLGFRWLNLALGLAVVAAGALMMAADASSDVPWLLPLGVVPENLAMPDYRPLLPWFGVVLFGLFAGNLVYGAGKRPPVPQSAPSPARPLVPMGENSLLIYLIHQPILIVLLAALGIIDLPSI
ncbi:MAG TPA: heparan-alpha-glucosaminide N-acetyltransferase [Rubrobacteraceae bacterium]|nr:heparan-alpha-glucosaminide N-acetyltransferase [Rubrobacteraceae bacterium]